ncbi:MAG: 4Fe-4S binding protein, partial [Desulfobacteraceae bacterium]|nr:4Fe-4S binding protein [Desulfobacteraceae bacterium]
CPKDAVQVKGERASVDYSKCIRCFCCHEVCPEKAIDLVTARQR